MLEVNAAGFSESEKFPKKMSNDSLWSDESDATLHASQSGCKQSVGDEGDQNPDDFEVISEQSMENFVFNDESFANVRPAPSIPDAASDETYADVTRAVECCRQAAQAGTSAALNTPGAPHENGAGVAKGVSEAVRFYRLAADQGDATAQRALGVCYANGVGVAKDVSEAVRFYRLAADQGDAEAQCALGVCYANGVGVA
jgi:TPR repeat protein